MFQQEIQIKGIVCHLNTNTNTNTNKNKNKNNTSKQVVSKVKEYDFFTLNEIRINNILHIFPKKEKRFITIKSAKKLKINDNPINNDKKYVLIKYNQEEDQYIEGFSKFVYNKGEKEYIYSVIESYIYILNSFLQLNKEGIVYYHFTSENVLFFDIYNPHCLLKGFQDSLLMSQMDESNSYSYFSNFIKKNQNQNQNFTFKAFEVHVLFYLYKMEEEYLSHYKITRIIDKFIENLAPVLKEQPESLLKGQCQTFMEPFINKNKKDIIRKLTSYYDTWDNYSLSILYLYLVENIIQGYQTQMRFMSYFKDILYENLSPNPEQRLSLEETMIRFHQLFKYWDE